MNSLSLNKLMAMVFPVVLVIQNPELREYFDIQPGPKFYHYLLPFFLALFIFRGPPRRLRELLALTAVAAVTVVLTGKITQQFFALVLFILMCVASAGVSDENDRWFRRGCLIAVGVLLLNILAHYSEIMQSGSENAEARAIYPTLMAAGVNIELSTLLLLCIYALPGRTLLVTVITFLLYYLFGTRALLVIWLIYISVIFKRVLFSAFLKHWKSLFAATVAALGIAVYSMANLELAFLERLMQIGKDPGSIGRLMLYEVAFSSSGCFSLGCGLGSASELIQSTRIANFFEDNFHNVYLQLLVEVGIAGLLAYVMLLVAALRLSAAKGDLALYVCLLATAALSFIQFTGFEVLSAYFIGRAIRNGYVSTAIDHRLHERGESVHGRSVHIADPRGQEPPG